MNEFPILSDSSGKRGPCPSSIPWEAIAPYEGQAKINHDQSLQRLAERGGLSAGEALMVMTGRRWSFKEDGEALEREGAAFLDKLVRESQVVKLSRQLQAEITLADRLARALGRVPVDVAVHDADEALAAYDAARKATRTKP